MIETIERADAANAALVVFTLRTPGGLVDSTRDIVTKMIAAKTPIVVYVAPSGARAASAGFIITIAADIAAMAPGTHIGAAHPVAGGRAAMDETTLEEGGGRHGRLRADDCRQARPQCAAGRAGGAAEQGVHRRGGAEGHASARRSRRDEPRRSVEESSTAAPSRDSTAGPGRCALRRRPSCRSR